MKPTWKVLQGDARSLDMPDKSVHAIMTSVPYWGLRRYLDHFQEIGREDTLDEWIINLVDCGREWRRVLRDDGTLWINCGDTYTSGNRIGHGTRIGYKQQTNRASAAGEDKYRPPMPTGLKPKDLIGLPWRLAFALQDDGWYLRNAICWAKGVDWLPNEQEAQGRVLEALQAVRQEAENSLFGLSSDLESALKQAERAVKDIQMAGPSMPESVTDRCAATYEHLFMFSKFTTYFYDQAAIKVPLQQASLEKGYTRAYMDGEETGKSATTEAGVRAKANWRANPYIPEGRNPRAVWLLWRINTEAQGTFVLPNGEEVSHFAAWPETLVRRIIKASTSECGVCATCGAAFERVIRKSIGGPRRSDDSKGDGRPDARGYMTGAGAEWQKWKEEHPDEEIGWYPTCTCHGEPVEGEVPCEKCRGTGRYHTTVHKQDGHMPEEDQRESHKRGIVPNMGENSMEFTDDPCPACICPDCEGTGEKVSWEPTCTCHGEPIEGEVPCEKCKGTGRQREAQDYEGKRREEDPQAAGRRLLANTRAARAGGAEHDVGVTDPTAVHTGPPCPACTCPDCQGTGRRMAYVRGGQPSKETSPQGKKQRRGVKIDGRTVFAPKEPTGEPCPTCGGIGALGHVQGPVWLDEVLDAWPIVPATVLDPMAGSGVSGRAALHLGRSAIINDLNPQYCRLMVARMEAFPEDVPTKRKSKEQELPDLPLFEGMDIEGI